MKLIMKLAFVNSNKPNALSAFFAKKKQKYSINALSFWSAVSHRCIKELATNRVPAVVSHIFARPDAMPLSLLYSVFGISVFWRLGATAWVGSFDPANGTTNITLIDSASKILCGFHTKVVYVYFENGTSSGYSGDILRCLSDCGTSYITLRFVIK